MLFRFTSYCKRLGLVKISRCLLYCILPVVSISQVKNNISSFSTLLSIEKSKSLTPSGKLAAFHNFRKILHAGGLTGDSTYGWTLNKIGLYESDVNNNHSIALNYALQSLRINAGDKAASSQTLAVRNFYDIAYYYYCLRMYSKALAYYDSTIVAAKQQGDTTELLLNSIHNRVSLLFQSGDYHKCIDESIIGIEYALKTKDFSSYLFFLNQRAQSLFFEKQYESSLKDLDVIINLCKNKNEWFELASALKIKGYIFAEKEQLSEAKTYFKQAVTSRLHTKDLGQIAGDYNDFGNFYLTRLKDYSSARRCYDQTISFAKKANDSIRLARAFINIGELYFSLEKFKLAGEYCLKALSILNFKTANILTNPPATHLGIFGNKELILVIMHDKLKILINLFLQSKDKKYLEAALRTAHVNDSLVTNIRYDQFGEQSKLYWREYSRSFFNYAMQVSFLAGDAETAFYFMEKSRAVLLNDQLNELAASASLPTSVSLKEQEFRNKSISIQLSLNTFINGSKEYNEQKIQMLRQHEQYERYIRFLEKQYPVYFNLKYVDNVPSVTSVQKYLAKNQQTFIDYFVADTILYVLIITGHTTKMIRVSELSSIATGISDFVNHCADKKTLYTNYKLFAALSHKLYTTLFKPLQIAKGRVVICFDNFLLPFEALCKDAQGKEFLIKDYAFSYIYSARYLLKNIDSTPAKGSFIGFAPVSFNPSLRLNDLHRSEVILKQAAGFYSSNKTFTNTESTRANFINNFSKYSIVNVFSHAYADGSDDEPVLFMHDSVIHLSELQLIKNASTRLVVLSACETNVGRNATGEGIYSLARGFAYAGIPSVAATLWKADEHTIYTISTKFQQYLSEGILPDVALQKAKLAFINEGHEKLLPYYWANMILTGKAEKIELRQDHYLATWIIAGVIFLVVFLAAIVFLRNVNVTKGF